MADDRVTLTQADQMHVLQAMRYLRVLACLMIVLGCWLQYVNWNFDWRRTVPDRLTTATYIALACWVPALLGFAFAANMALGQLWAIVGSIVLASVALLVLMFAGLVAVLVPLRLAVLIGIGICVVLAVAAIVYSGLALSVVLKARRR